jgi:hypothetical protein
MVIRKRAAIVNAWSSRRGICSMLAKCSAMIAFRREAAAKPVSFDGNPERAVRRRC